MAAASFHKETGRWLTSLGRDAKAGDEITLSIGQTLGGGEFTTYRLGAAVAHNEYGEALFDLDEAERQLRGPWTAQGQAVAWATKAEVEQAIANASFDAGLTIKGLRFRRSAFGHWCAA